MVVDMGSLLGFLIDASLILYFAAMVSSILLWFNRRLSLSIGLSTGFLASIILGIGSLAGLITGSIVSSNLLGGIDELSLVFTSIIGFAGAASCIYGVDYMLLYEGIGGYWLYSLVLNGFLASMMLLSIVKDLLLFVFMWEIMTLTSIVLIGWEYSSREVVDATKQYLYTMLILNTFPLTVGVAIIWGVYGSTDLSVLEKGAGNPWILLATLLFYTAFISKAGLYPLHYWLPDAHPAAPSNISSLLSGVMIKMGVLGLLRIVFYGLNPPIWLAYLLLAQAILSIYWGSLGAIREGHAKRLLAYSSISHIGYISVPLATSYIAYSTGYQPLSILFLSATLIYVFAHSMFKTLLFLVSGYYLFIGGTAKLDDIRGIAWFKKILPSALIVGLLSLAGLPPFIGFIAKLSIYGSLLSSGSILSTIVFILVMAASPLTILYAVKFALPALHLEKNNGVEKVETRLMDTGVLIPLVIILLFSIMVINGSFVKASNCILGSLVKAELINIFLNIGDTVVYIPIIFAVSLILGILAGYLDHGRNAEVSSIWTTGYIIPLDRHRIRPGNMYIELTKPLEKIYGFSHEVYDCLIWRIPSKIVGCGAASRITSFFDGLNRWFAGKLEGFAKWYSGRAGEFKLDEAAGRIVVLLVKAIRSYYRMIVVSPIALFIASLFVLSLIMLILMLVVGW